MDSLFGILLAIPLISVIVFRIVDEEKILKLELDGYEKYCKETKYRLIPYAKISKNQRLSSTRIYT